jgi:hypothetical protein
VHASCARHDVSQGMAASNQGNSMRIQHSSSSGVQRTSSVLGIRHSKSPTALPTASTPQLSSVPAGRPISPTLPLPLSDQTDVYLPYRSNRIVFDKAVSTRPRWSSPSRRGRSRRQSPTMCRGGRDVLKLTLRHRDFANCHSHTCSAVLTGPRRPVSPGGEA